MAAIGPTTEPFNNFTELMFSDNATCTNITDFTQAQQTVSHAVQLASSILTFILGVTGNLTLIYLIRRTERRLSNPSIFIMNMAIGDMVFLLIYVPSYCSVQLSSQWYGETAGCKLTYFVRYLTLGVSIFTLTALSTDRYFAIARPFKQTNNRRRSLFQIGMIWSVAALLGCPATIGARQLVVLLKQTAPNCKEIRVCYPAAPDDSSFIAGLLWFKVLTYFFIPLVLIASFYGAMTVVLCRSSFLDNPAANGSCGAISNPAASRQLATAMRRAANRRKLARTVLCLVAMFIICWLPSNVYSIIYFVMGEVSMSFKAVATQLTFIYSCVNPITLFVLSKRIRRDFRQICCCGGSENPLTSGPVRSTSWAEPCFRRVPNSESRGRGEWRYPRQFESIALAPQHTMELPGNGLADDN